MPFRIDRRLTGLVLSLAVVVTLSACGKKRPPVLATTPGGEGAGAGQATEPVDRAGSQPLDEGPDVRAMEGEGAEATDLAGGALGTVEGGPLADIRFVYDSASLTDEARATLEKHALWLQGRRDLKVAVEGHCDERGTVEYNLALGEQRARAARDYLVSLGVAGERLRVVSYGKERPLDPGSGEASWAKNRRAHFAVSR
jgi:peptidoglycan-associated lipoprotein